MIRMWLLLMATGSAIAATGTEAAASGGAIVPTAMLALILLVLSAFCS